MTPGKSFPKTLLVLIVVALIALCVMCGQLGAWLILKKGLAGGVTATATVGILMVAFVAAVIGRQQAQTANETFFESERPYVVPIVEPDIENQTYIFDISN